MGLRYSDVVLVLLCNIIQSACLVGFGQGHWASIVHRISDIEFIAATYMPRDTYNAKIT